MKILKRSLSISENYFFRTPFHSFAIMSLYWSMVQNNFQTTFELAGFIHFLKPYGVLEHDTHSADKLLMKTRDNLGENSIKNSRN